MTSGWETLSAAPVDRSAFVRARVCTRPLAFERLGFTCFTPARCVRLAAACRAVRNRMSTALLSACWIAALGWAGPVFASRLEPAAGRPPPPRLTSSTAAHMRTVAAGASQRARGRRGRAVSAAPVGTAGPCHASCKAAESSPQKSSACGAFGASVLAADPIGTRSSRGPSQSRGSGTTLLPFAPLVSSPAFVVFTGFADLSCPMHGMGVLR